MLKISLRYATSIAVASLLALGRLVYSVVENVDRAATSSPASSYTVPTSPAPAQPQTVPPTPAAAASSPTTAQPQTVPPTPAASSPATAVSGRDPYNEAIDLASSAINYSKSAAIKEDWAMVASRWQQAVDYLQAVPQSHQKYAEAQTKLPQYQRFLADAQLKAKPTEQPEADASGDVNPKFFIIPIKERIRGIPLVEVKFNGVRNFDMLFDTGASSTLLSGQIAATLNLKKVATGVYTIADGSAVKLPIVVVDSMEINGRVKRKVSTAVARNMRVGLLGQDFFEGYDFTIRENAIEFHLR